MGESTERNIERLVYLKWFVLLFFLGYGLISFTYSEIGADKDLYKKIHDTLVYNLDHPDTLGVRKLYFYFNSGFSSVDSFSVIGAMYYGEDADYAVIVHDKFSKGHASFSPEKIKAWKEETCDEVVWNILARCDTLHTVLPEDSDWFNDLKGYWVRVEKFQGRYYLHNDWATLIAYELTDSTWVNIDMEVHPELLFEVGGNKEHFTLTTEHRRCDYKLIDKEKEIYRVGSSALRAVYLIPVRRIHEFEIIEYLSTQGDLVDSFIDFDKE